jgi:hypothetical protein
MLRTSLFAAVAVFALAGAASAAALQPTDFVHRHMAAAAKGDLDALVADYADDAVTITAGGATVGKAAIRAQFAKMFPGGGKPAAGPGGPMKAIKIWQEGPVGMVSWESGPVKGTDAFVIKNGKIQSQSVFMAGPPPGPRPAAK